MTIHQVCRCCGVEFEYERKGCGRRRLECPICREKQSAHREKRCPYCDRLHQRQGKYCSDEHRRRYDNEVLKHRPESQEARRIRERAKRATMQRICAKCGAPVGFNRFVCDDCQRKSKAAYSKKQRDRLKAEVFSHYGTVCQCCGESDIRFLTIDHVNGDGAEHRRKIADQRGRGNGGNTMYRWLRSNGYPSGFQVLCFNCNCGRQHNNGVCPHQDGGAKEV